MFPCEGLLERSTGRTLLVWDPRKRWQTPSKATVAQLTCLETNRHLEGMSVNFLISPISHVTCSFGLRFLSCIEETKMIGLRLKHSTCSVNGKWPEAAGALLILLEVAAQPCGTSLNVKRSNATETWSHRPTSQAPGLGSFLANVIPSQVNVRQSFVDF